MFGERLRTVLAESQRFRNETARLQADDAEPRRHGSAFSTDPTIDAMLEAVDQAAREDEGDALGRVEQRSVRTERHLLRAAVAA